MADLNVLQPKLLAQFEAIIARGELSQAYIFAGPAGVGKAALAQWIAQRLFCQNVQAGQPCGQCAECQRVLSGNHPDVVWLQSDAKSIKVDDIRNLKAEMSKTGVESNQRIFIVTDAEKLTAGAENSLLKFYEEPVPGMTIILTTSAKNQLLPTIVSRAQVINFQPAPAQAVIDQLTAAGIAPQLASVAGHLTADVAAAQTMAEAPQFEKQVGAVLMLLRKTAAQDSEAFVMVQTQLVPNAKTPADQKQLLAMLALGYGDALNRHYQVQAPQTFGQAEVIEQLSELSGPALSRALAAILAAQIKLGQNVTFQSAVEQLVLTLLEG